MRATYFEQDPAPFYHLVRELFPKELTPTDTHRFFTLLHQKGILRRIYTQNIDALEHIGGVPEEKIIEAHGTFHKNHCVNCQKEYSLDWLKNQLFGNRKTGEKFLADDPDYVPKWLINREYFKFKCYQNLAKNARGLLDRISFSLVRLFLTDFGKI